MFLRSIETGLRDDNILTKLRPILQDTKISDEELIHQVSSISSAETERQARLGKKSRDLQANAVLSSEGQNRQLISQKNPSETKDSHILAAVKAMQAQIKNIQEQLASQNSNTQPTSNTITESLRKCSSCLAVRYCSKDCELKHWREHKIICEAINKLSTRRLKEQDISKDDVTMIPAHLTPHQQASIVKLVGQKCAVNIKLDGLNTQGLWDTGTQVSVISKEHVMNSFPSKQIHKIEDLLPPAEEVKLYAANGTPIPYEGFIELALELSTANVGNKHVIVPFLVTTGALDLPIIGYNTICELIKDKDGIIQTANQAIINQIKASFPSLTDTHDSKILINLIKESTEQDYVCSMKTPKRNMVIPKGSTLSIACRGNRKTQIIHINVENETDHDICLQNRTVVGHLQLVQSVIPLEVNETENHPSHQEPNACQEHPTIKENINTDPPRPGFEGLTDEQNKIVQKMLEEELGSFSANDSDIGIATGLEMNIELNDHNPVQKNYLTVPRPLYGKAYHQGFIAPDSRNLTAFITPWGLFQWNRIPFGLTNAPAVFQRHMEDILRDLCDKYVIPYLDDIIIFSKTFDEHVTYVRSILRRLREHGIKLKRRKCELFKKQVRFLGKIILEDGYKIDENNVRPVTSLLEKEPKTVGDL
eukprot:gene4301-4870_t